MKEDFLGKYKNVKQLSWGLGLYSSASIFGPLLIIGGFGYCLDKIFGTKPWFLFISIFIAFFVTNFLLFKKVVALNKWISRRKEMKKNENKIKNDSAVIDTAISQEDRKESKN